MKPAPQERLRNAPAATGRFAAELVIILAAGERMFAATTTEIHRFLGLVLLLSLVIGIYLTMQEIDRAIGKGVLLRLLLERPVDSEARPHPEAMDRDA